MAQRGVNKVIIVGNLGADPEVRFMPSGDAVANLTLATSETWKDKQTGEDKEKTEWHRVAIFGKLAEIAGEYLKKGSKIYIEGKLQTRKWQNQQGQDQYTTEIVLQGYDGVMQMLDSRPQGGNAQPQQQPQQVQQQTPQQQAKQHQGGYQQQPQQGGYQQQPQQGGYQQQPQQQSSYQQPQQQPQQGGYQQAAPQSQMDDDDIPF